jgi:hypothetical protein
MAKYRVLPSAAHNYGASFISVMNMARDDYAMCHLLRAAKRTGLTELRIDLLDGSTEPRALLSPQLEKSIAHYCAGFGPHIQRSGSALDMISSADLRVRVQWGRVVGSDEDAGALHARLQCEISIVDDRGKQHVGSTIESWICHETRPFY